MSDTTTDSIVYTPMWQNLYFLLEPSCILLISLASLTVLVGAIRSLYYESETRKKGISEESHVVIDAKTAALFPIAGSIALLTFFYLFTSIQFILLIFISIASTTGVTFTLTPVASLLAQKHPAIKHHVILCGHECGELGHCLAVCFSLVTLLGWICSGSFLLHNILGLSLCISFIAFVKLQNIKVCTYLLTALFFYDIFWVFISQHIFGSNVMLEAATKEADNPAAIAAEALHLPQIFNTKLDLPVKLLLPLRLFNPQPGDPPLMLGLGDMALPGMLLALVLEYDVHRHRTNSSTSGGKSSSSALSNITSSSGSLSISTSSITQLLTTWRFWKSSYTLLSWCGYIIGMCLALGFSTVFQAAQPALLYLVPLCVGPVLVVAKKRGEFKEVWEGVEEDWKSLDIEGKDIV